MKSNLFSCITRSTIRDGACTLLLVFCAAGIHAQDLLPTERQTQRQLYLDAQAALADEDLGTFAALRSELIDYPLVPYLDYALLTSALDDLPVDQVHAFLDEHDGTVLARQLQREWQRELAQQEAWSQLIADYDARYASTEISCQVLQARLRAGDTSALDDVEPLWNVARSQPNICDPLFETWIAAGRLTPTLGWQRFEKAMQAGNQSFARYLSTLLPERERELATLWVTTVQQPERLGNTDEYASSAPELEVVLKDTLRRLARGNPVLAWQLSDVYAAMHDYMAEEQTTLQRYIVQRMLIRDEREQAEALLLEYPTLATDTLIEAVLRAALERQDWDHVDTWLPRLSDTAKATERWRYWQARSLARSDRDQANAILAEVAATRTFYGFLAADILDQDYALVDRPVTATPDELRQVMASPALARAVELHFLGEERSAVAEWQHALASMTEREVLVSARLADRLGWHRNGIAAMIQVSYWDDLEVRFPLAYRDRMDALARQHEGLDPTFVYAIARQESAFISDARSSAGAMGLMQLMPGTARDAARDAGLGTTGTPDLFDPDVNLTLGSQYLAKMLRDFEGNRALAAAAYNAGPSRVRGWLREERDNRVPLDIWIETMPFGETRGYVQNVLAFAVIYGYRMGREVSMLTPGETETLL